MQDQALKMPDFDLGEHYPASVTAEDAVRAILAGDAKQIEVLTKKLSGERAVVEKYGEVQHVQLAKLQFRLLDAITDQKLYDASLRDIVGAFKALKDKELVAQGRPTEIHGLVGYLEILEKEERGEVLHTSSPTIVDVTPSNTTEHQLTLFEEIVEPTVAEEPLPCL